MKAFKVVKVLGKGSYGTVMQCKRKTDGETWVLRNVTPRASSLARCYRLHRYAIKEVNIRKLSPREREDAVNEIRILASIRHTNIVRCVGAKKSLTAMPLGTTLLAPQRYLALNPPNFQVL